MEASLVESILTNFFFSFYLLILHQKIASAISYLFLQPACGTYIVNDYQKFWYNKIITAQIIKNSSTNYLLEQFSQWKKF